MRTRIIVAIMALAGLAGCEAATPTAPAATTTVAAAPAKTVPGEGCGQTPVHTGGTPAWAASAGVLDLPYVVSHEGNLLGVLWADLVSPPNAPPGPNNKILWISREPRGGQDLKLTLSPAAGGTGVTVTVPDGSSPGEIYPSIVDVPAAGCWNVVAEWNGNRATLELSYAKP